MPDPCDLCKRPATGKYETLHTCDRCHKVMARRKEKTETK
jgi:hypothetical protein